MVASSERSRLQREPAPRGAGSRGSRFRRRWLQMDLAPKEAGSKRQAKKGAGSKLSRL